MTISARPPQPTTAADGPGRCRHRLAVSATNPPTANSQARDGSEKNAHDGSECVHASEMANEMTATSASTSA